MATSSREARRRRIVDRGSDRLALITGRIQTLPSSSSPPELHHSHMASCPPPQPIGSHDDEDKSSSFPLPQHESAEEPGEIDANDSGRDQPVLQKCETSTEALRAPSGEVESLSQSSQVVSTVQDSSFHPSDTEYQREPQVHRGKIFTSNQISSAIAATESTRLYCSLAAAILVVLSCVGFPILGGSIIKSTIFLRPPYLVLLTNISIVVARLLSQKQGGLERTQQVVNDVSPGGYGFAEQAGKALESGLVLQNIMGALFIDCSVYAIVVICGLSVAQKLGW